jgi:hypothetical protein
MTLVSNGSTEQTSHVGNHSKYNMKEKKKEQKRKTREKMAYNRSARQLQVG